MGQEQPCIFCLINQGKVQSAKVYEDEQVTAFLDIKPASEGHIQVVSKTHAPLINMLPPEERIKLFNTAVSIGSGLIQKLGASGITYLINEGAGAGQRIPHASIQLIPRYENDSVSISWEDKDLSQEEVNNYLQRIINKLQTPTQASPAPEIVQQEPNKKDVEEENQEEEEVVEEEERIPTYW